MNRLSSNNGFRVTRWLTLLAVFCSAVASAAAPVWKVSDGDRHLYIGGTIHMLAAKDYPLPPSFDTTYAQAQLLVLEVDIQQAQANGLATMMGAGLLWPSGESLQQKVSAETWTLFEQAMQARNLPAATFNLYKPGGLIMALLPAELMRFGVGTAGVDSHYASRASRDQKAVVGLETMEQQMAMIRALGIGNEDRFLRYFVRDLDNLQQQFEAMRRDWRAGDMQALAASANLEEMQLEFPRVYQSLLVERNNAWMPKIEQMLDTEEVELVLVGALHLVGRHGVLQQLLKAGYTVQQFP
jgi:uncharacterized protein YbaP (TraB family)